MASIQPDFDRIADPLDVVEQLASIREWSFERSTEDELNLSVSGSWSDYHVSFNWRDDLETLHLACAFDMKVPAARRDEISRLIGQVNEQMWLGHFDFWTQESLVMFRYGLVLNGGADATPEQCDAMLTSAVEACERYYQAFQFVIWAGKGAAEALESTLFETAGQA